MIQKVIVLIFLYSFYIYLIYIFSTFVKNIILSNKKGYIYTKYMFYYES